MPSMTSREQPKDINEAIDRYHERLIRFLRVLVGDRHASEDLAQEIWLLIHAGKRIFDPTRGSYWTWLSWLARQRAFVHNRSARSRPLVRLADEANGPVDESAAREEAGRETLEYVEGLAPDHREVIWLYYMEGMKCDEIATVLGCRVGTVHSRLHSARKKLEEGLRCSIS